MQTKGTEKMTSGDTEEELKVLENRVEELMTKWRTACQIGDEELRQRYFSELSEVYQIFWEEKTRRDFDMTPTRKVPHRRGKSKLSEMAIVGSAIACMLIAAIAVSIAKI